MINKKHSQRRTTRPRAQIQLVCHLGDIWILGFLDNPASSKHHVQEHRSISRLLRLKKGITRWRRILETVYHAFCFCSCLLVFISSSCLAFHFTVDRADSFLSVDLSNSAMLNTTMIRSVASIEPDENDYDGEQLFIKPPGFRPNSLFVGRQEELNELHKMLFDPRRRSEGTSAVLIQSMPGGGKSHLARQYVYEHRQYYPGGIFWLRAKSLSELAMGFWEIARIAAIKSAMVDEDFKILDENDQFIKIVTRWLNHRHDWLMVLDGIHFDDHFRKFIPDSTNTSLIYTSTEKSVSGDHHFVNPQLLKLPALSAREAQQLLLLELGKREPFSKDDLLHSMELVQAMGFLPVVIHTVAQRLKATDEPLARYARSYASGPRLRDLNAFTSVADQLRQLEAFEALNLMMIICFYSQHIPVEMISLGEFTTFNLQRSR